MASDPDPMVEPRVDAILARIRSAGGRATLPRRAILAVLLDHQDVHPSAEHITSSVRRRHPDVADSTVYRFLEELERLDIVRAVTLGSGPTLYHFAEDADHHHLACKACGQVTEILGSVLTGVRRTILRDYGFDVDATHLTLMGRCASCAGGAIGGRDTPRFHDHTH